MEMPGVLALLVGNGRDQLHSVIVSGLYSCQLYCKNSCVAVDCGDLEAPANGRVNTSQGTHFMVTAVYSCVPGYNLTGCPEAACQSNATWSCDPPFCAGKSKMRLLIVLSGVHKEESHAHNYIPFYISA